MRHWILNSRHGLAGVAAMLLALSLPDRAAAGLRRDMPPDAYEPDNSAAAATAFGVGLGQDHTFHAAGDEDWVYLYAVTSVTYQVQAQQHGTNVDVRLEVYYLPETGSLTNLDWLTADGQGKGAGKIEQTTLDFINDPDLAPGFYYVRACSADSNAWGASSEYDLAIFEPTGFGGLTVYALDDLNPGQPPGGATAEIIGVATQALGTSAYVRFGDLDEGVYTVRVTAAAGYWPMEGRDEQNQVTSLTSEYFGNPKQVQLAVSDRIVVFRFEPRGAVAGAVRDAWSGAWLADAGLSFTALGGLKSGAVYTGYPFAATYAVPWRTAVDGTFPTNVLLPAGTWSLAVTRPGYLTNALPVAVTNLVLGTTTNLGRLWLTPADCGNVTGSHTAIAREWTDTYFSGTVVNADADADGDGLANWCEYRAGTDPTNPASGLSLAEVTPSGSDQWVLTWATVPGREYSLDAATTLPASDWQPLYGPFVATGVQSTVTLPANGRTGLFIRASIPGGP